MKENIFVKRPIFAMVIAIIFVILGIISITQLPIAQYPDVTPPMVQVSAMYQGADAVNVAQSVTTPLEESINGVQDMLYMSSINSSSGDMSINVSFDIDSNPNMNTVFTANRVSAATAQLPSSVVEMGVTTEETMTNFLMVLSLYSTDNTYDELFLSNYAKINIEDEIARLNGVGSVDVMGAGDYAMRIWVQPDKLDYMGISIDEVENAVRTQNANIPGGKFGAEPTSSNTQFTYTILMPNQRTSVEEFEEIVVRTLSDGSHVYLKDIATIELGAVNYNLTAESNDKPCTVILVNQVPGSNAIELSEMVTAKMDEISKKFPPHMKYDIIIDSTAPVVAGIKEILTTLGFALILVILVIYIFLQSARATLIPLVAIPVSLIGAFIFFPLLGFSINVLTLLGLVLAIGIVVDDAIVVVEAVQVNIEKGMNSKEATIKAMQVVSSPIIATTIVLVAVFIPVSLMGGITGRLYQQFAITITFSVIISTINALTLSPALCSLVLRPKDKNKKEKNTLLQKFFNWFNRVFGRGVDRYLSATEILTNKTKRGAFYLVVIAIAGFFTMSYLPKSFLPEEDQGYIMLSIQLPNAASLNRTYAVVSQVSDIIREYDFVQFVTTVSGYNILSSSMSSYTGIVWVKLIDWSERSVTASEFVDKLNKEMYFAINGASVYAFGPPAILGLGTASGFSMVLLDKGDNTPMYLAEQTDLFIEACKKEPAIGMVNSTYEADIPQKAFIINDKMALKAGVDLNDLHSILSSFMGGSYINKFNRFGRIYDTYLAAGAEYRQSEKDLDLFSVQNSKGESFPLSSFVTVRDTIGPEFINHYNLFRSVTLMGQSAAGYSSIETTDALERVAAKTLPSDMDYMWTDMSYQEQHAGSGATALLLSLTFVFLILAALYESWSLPLTILLGTPFAIFGATLFMLIGRYIDPIYSDDVFLQISLVMLVAMAAKNAILVIQYAVDIFEEGGRTLKEAALEAAKSRIRPIMMTAFSFILGIMPLIIASGANSISRRVMGLALLGGMLMATILGIFFYPMLYVLIGKMAGYDKKSNVELETKTEE